MHNFNVIDQTIILHMENEIPQAMCDKISNQIKMYKDQTHTHTHSHHRPQ